MVAQFRPDDDFDWTVTVPADDVARAAGAIAIETDPVYLPGRRKAPPTSGISGCACTNVASYPVTP